MVVEVAIVAGVGGSGCAVVVFVNGSVVVFLVVVLALTVEESTLLTLDDTGKDSDAKPVNRETA